MDSGKMYLGLFAILMLFGFVRSNNPPRITVASGTNYISKPEDTPIGTVLLTLTATDSDSNEVTFKRATGDTQYLTKLSAVTKTADHTWEVKVILNATLDSDNSPPTRTLFFTVTDDARNEVSYRIPFFITDVNDNPPRFTGLPYRTTVKEDASVGTSVFTVTATDPDQGLGQQITYQINASNPADNTEYLNTFELNPRNGTITLNGPLDYEKRSFYHFKVSAKDNGNPPCPGVDCLCKNEEPLVCNPDPVDLFITIEDIQDTPPVFEKLPYIVTIPESEPVGSSIFQVTAVDGDRAAAVKNNIQYSFIEGDDNYFHINKDDGTITVAKALDVDNEGMLNRGGLFIFTIQAKEVSPNSVLGSTGEDDTMISSTKISITVTDVNDNEPAFNSLNYTASVLENTPNGVPLTMTTNIEVSDIDQGMNSRFKIHLEKDGAPYADFRTLPDQNQIIQGATTINIIVVNSSVLDFENEKTITFQIVAQEVDENGTSTSKSAVATIKVTVEDVNDNNPEFSNQTTSFDVPENKSVGSVIANITATDPDSGDYGNITFSLETSGQHSDFIISDTGELSVNCELDRERRSSYLLTVIATDNPSAPESQRRRSRLLVTIIVTDVNDNEPKWPQYIPQVSVMETEPVNTSVTELMATDQDDGVNAQIEYTVSPGTNGSELFSVRKKDNGAAELYVEKSLIGYPGLQLVRVIASDQGQPPRNSSVDINVIVIDMNLHKPVFVVPDQNDFNVTLGKLPEVKVEEELPIGSPLIQLKAEDVDLGENGKVFYYLEPTVNKDYEYFKLDRLTGNLTNAKRLDREKQEEYEIQVKAEDNGQPAPLSTTLNMKVILLDKDDNLPSYEGLEMPQIMTVKEEKNNQFVGQVSPASDADSENNSIICYYLFGGANMTLFQLDKHSGDLTLLTALDRETIHYMDLVIKASDDCDNTPETFSPTNGASSTVTGSQNDSPSFYNSSDQSLLWIRIHVKDVNDNPPLFKEKSMSTALIFDEEVGTEILSLKNDVTDADSAANNENIFNMMDIKPMFENMQGNLNKPEFILSQNGSLVTNTRFRSDMVGYFLLKVEVLDKVKPDLNDQAEIKIYLVSNLQRVKLVINKTPVEFEAVKKSFIKELSDALSLNLVIDSIKTHVADDQTRDPTKTDAYIHGRYRDTNDVVPAPDLWRAFDFNQAAGTVLFKYKVLQAQELFQEATTSSSEELKRLMVIVTATLGIVVVALILVLAHLVRMYRRRLRAATTMAYTSPKEQEMYEHPGTNKYYSAENPLYGKEIKPADVEDDNDRTSQNSLDVNMVDSPPPAPPAFADEEQEVVLSISDSPEPLGPDYGTKPDGNLNLTHVLEAYDNPAFDTDSKFEDNKNPMSNGHVRGMPYYVNGGSTIPGVDEAVTRFSDDVLSKDSGYPEANGTQSHMEHTDI